MDEAPGSGDTPAAGDGLPGCYRHPDRETGVRCARCERPICPECMISAAVGFQCPECVSSGSGTGHTPQANAPRTLTGGVTTAGDPRLVTKVLLGINAAVFLAVLATRSEIVADLVLIGQWPPGDFAVEGVAEGEWYRLLTSVFLHEAVAHFLLNMLALWFLGPPLEAALGRTRFTTLYLLSGLGGSALFYVIDPHAAALGASGAIFGLFGATAVLLRRLNQPMGPILVLLALNLAITFTISGIAWQGHIGGLVVGTGVAYGFVHAPRGKRALVQRVVAAGALLVIAAVIAIRTVTLS